MFAGLYAKLAGLGVVLALLGGAALYMHHMGAVSQQAADQAKYDTLKTLSDSYKAQVRNDATAMVKINRDAADARSYADLQKFLATAAIQQLHADENARSATDAAWRAKLAEAVKTKGCQAQLSANLCPAVPSY